MEKRELQKIIQDTLNRWAPFPEESFEIRVMRALLNLNAFEEDFKAFKKGERPIRTDYPISFE